VGRGADWELAIYWVLPRNFIKIAPILFKPVDAKNGGANFYMGTA